MRPLQLEMQGFSAFRTATTVDFRGHDLIALTGPTGAGKSTIIDGIVFALYGSVARYGNEKLVAPIINAVSTEARVRLDFSVGDVEYTAVRVLRRTNAGASTKEARLESGDTVLASTAQEVTAEVERLLGLSFTQFTKTVVLPQGDFARFLTEKAGARQKLLRRLLGLEKYAAVGKAARQRARHLQSQHQAIEKALNDESTLIKASDIVALEKSVSRLTESLDEAIATVEARKDAHTDLADVQATLDDIDDRSTRLTSMTMPAEAKTYAASLTKAEAAHGTVVKKRDAAHTKLTAAEESRNALLGRVELDALLATHEQVAALTELQKEQATRVGDAAVSLSEAASRAEDARDALGLAEDGVAAARSALGAQGIAATLHAGDQCPVCNQVVESLPAHAADRHGAKAEEAVATAEKAKVVATKRATAAVNELQEATALHAEQRARHDATVEAAESFADALAGQPTHKQTLAIEKRVMTAEAKLDNLQETVDELQDAVKVAAAAVDDARNAGTALRQQFTATRDAVASMSPPQPSEESLKDDWAALITWGKAAASALKVERREVARQHADTSKRAAAAEKKLLLLSEPHLAPAATPSVDTALSVLSNEHADARVRLANAEDRFARQQANAERVADIERERLVADELGKHLASGMFERWIMSDVMADLSERASVRLLELSAGAYSLTSDGTSFHIIDHRNADELRNARTLSGGETFLTSLALALALADSITELAANTTPPLESMFLDEGFGTLDPETLDIVASAIEELGASGRMIGIVTHIRDLADRVPTRFDVQRNPNGSIVTPIG